MPTPKKKTSKSRRDMRRSHDGLTTPAMAIDKKSGELVRPLMHKKNIVTAGKALRCSEQSLN